MPQLGIDVSKETLDTTLKNRHFQKKEQIANQAQGFKKLHRQLSQKYEVETIHVCLEATNIYWEEAAEFFHDHGYRVSVVNPARISGFAQSQLRRNKTDPLDSEVIADFCAAVEPELWTPPTPEQRHLRALVRHRLALQKTLTQQQNRLATCREAAVQASLENLRAFLEAEIEQIEHQIETFIQHQPDLKASYDLLTSIPGLGPKTAVVLLAEMYDLANYKKAPAAAADAGLTPRHHTSGQTIRRKPKLSKMGKSAVRGALFWPAITAMRHNPLVRALKERLEARGKHWKVIVGAAMRKLLHLAYGVLKNQTPFDPNYSR
jgi:transposase